MAPPILLLFHNISDNSDLDESNVEDYDTCGSSVLAVPETIEVPYKLRSAKTSSTINPSSEDKTVVSCPYLTQAKWPSVLAELSEEAAEVSDAVFKNISVLFPLQTVYNEFPGLRCMIKK